MFREPNSKVRLICAIGATVVAMTMVTACSADAPTPISGSGPGSGATASDVIPGQPIDIEACTLVSAADVPFLSNATTDPANSTGRRCGFTNSAIPSEQVTLGLAATTTTPDQFYSDVLLKSTNCFSTAQSAPVVVPGLGDAAWSTECPNENAASLYAIFDGVGVLLFWKRDITRNGKAVPTVDVTALLGLMRQIELRLPAA